MNQPFLCKIGKNSVNRYNIRPEAVFYYPVVRLWA
uniref:Uncharacterized protein n=1 Tax=Siphoviridae sp. ct5kv15 TaxID=2825338 RepID=A0A8S5PM23_9CAUD|nr:MAG TPA: hypothetical protein [Siphoviridae sp. ct5kv15]